MSYQFAPQENDVARLLWEIKKENPSLRYGQIIASSILFSAGRSNCSYDTFYTADMTLAKKLIAYRNYIRDSRPKAQPKGK